MKIKQTGFSRLFTQPTMDPECTMYCNCIKVLAPEIAQFHSLQESGKKRKIWVLRPFQEYFPYIEPIVNQEFGENQSARRKTT